MTVVVLTRAVNLPNTQIRPATVTLLIFVFQSNRNRCVIMLSKKC